MTTSAPTACVLCGSSAAPRPELDGALRRCPDCSFMWTATPIGDAEDVYDEGYYAGGGYDDYFQPAARRFESGLRLRWLQRHHRPKSLVEAGCAAGFFVETAEHAGIVAHGFEVSPASSQYARDVLHVHVETGRFEAAGLSGACDSVCAFHVLEHVDDPMRFVDAAWDALTPGGVLALEVPNIASAAARRAGLEWAALQPEYHRWHFSPTTLTDLVTRRGFAVVAIDTTVFRFYMPRRFRWRQGRHHIREDVRNLHTIRLTHPRDGDLLRLIARRKANS
jgi:SAM-dependent methyltransferase